VDFKTTSYIRGMTLNDTIVIVDECQNLSFHELDSVITRIGDNCKIIFCGDFRQSDFNKSNEKNGINIFMDIIKNLQDISFIEFDEEDIVRSEFVKSYIIQKLKMGLV
jgi:phosphate starvation-inducible protein PhoH